MTNLLEWGQPNLGMQQLLIMLCVLLGFAVVIPTGVIAYNLLKFKKANYEKSYISKLLIIVLGVLVLIEAVLNILGFVFYYGANIMPDNYDLAKTLVIVFVALNAAFAVAYYYILLLQNKYIALGIGSETINIFGDLYKTSKVVSLVLDKGANKISLHIAVGKRVVKRISYKLTSMCGQCLQNSTSVLGVEIIEGDDKAIHIEETQVRQEEFRQSLTRSSAALRGTDAKAEAPKASGASRVSKAKVEKPAEEKIEEVKENSTESTK